MKYRITYRKPRIPPIGTWSRTPAARAWGRLARNPMVRGAAVAYEGARLAKRVYRNVERKRKTRSYVEQSAKKRRTTVPTKPSHKVPARMAIAPSTTKFKKAKSVRDLKAPKSAIVHYRDFGQFNAEKCLWINHQHWGHVDRLWKGISMGLTKLLLSYAKCYNGKSFEDPIIGPRTQYADLSKQWDDKVASTKLYLHFSTQVQDGNVQRSAVPIDIEDVAATPDNYRTFDQIATDVANALRGKYEFDTNSWLESASIVLSTIDENHQINAQPIFIQNLDDAEINLYVHSLIKLQNVTASDSNSADKHQVDANPLVGRMFSAKGYYPHVDADLLASGDKTLDNFFMDVESATEGITLLGHANLVTANDYGRISHIPNAKELYGNQTVKTARVYMGPGATKYHKTTFTLKKTFRQLAGNAFVMPTAPPSSGPGRPWTQGMHTMFGLTCQHKHDELTLSVGYDRDMDVGCYIKHKRIVHPLKTNYTLNSGSTTLTAVPADLS